VEEKFKIETLLAGHSLFDEGHTEGVPKREFFVPRPLEDVNNYIVRDYNKDYSPKLKHYEEQNPNIILNTTTLPKESLNSKEHYSDLSFISELKLSSSEIIKPKPEYLSSSLGQLAAINFIEKNQSKQIRSISSPPLSLLSSGNAQQSFGGYLDLGATKPEDLPEMALPVLEFMEDVQPHIVIGCDRGGRLFSLAMRAAWHHTRSGQPFPTLDGKLHFARVSKSEDFDVLQEKIDQIVEASKRLGKQRGNEIADDEQLRVLFIDDWVIGGGTMRLAQRLMKKHNAQTNFAVMCGEGADVTGKKDLHTHVSWHDRPEEIGVNYLSTLQENSDGSITQKQEVIAVRGIEAIRNRQQIHQAAQQLASVRALAEVA
jgi:adenine/guanine phosphoribosyltransferase-like PRPP-binding protein